MDIEGCGRLSEHDGLWEVEGFTVCKCGGSLVGVMCLQHALHEVYTYV